MNLSKEPASATKPTDPPLSVRSRGRIVRWAAPLTLLAVSAAGVVIWYAMTQRRVEQALAEARQLLSELPLAGDSAARERAANQSQELLESVQRFVGRDRQREWHLLHQTALLAAGGLQSEDALRSAVPEDASTPDLVMIAAIAFGRGRPQLADEFIERALQRRDAREQALRVAVNIRYELGREEDVLAHCKELSELRPDDPRPWLVVAMVQEDRGYWEHLEDVYRRLLELLPPGEQTGVRVRLLRALLEVGDADAARAEFDRLQQEIPDQIDRLAVLHARLLQLEGRAPEAEKLVDDILKSRPQETDAYPLKARLLLARGNAAEAVEVLKQLVALQPSDHQAHYLLGQAYARAGNADAAKAELQVHRKLLDLRVKIHSLERVAGRESGNRKVREELAAMYSEIGLEDMAAFWQRAAAAVRPEAAPSSGKSAAGSKLPAATGASEF